jgi:YgiT-type zinc finger domain-containing protein
MELWFRSMRSLQMSCCCDVCGFESARVRRLPRSYGTGSSLLVIEQVPVVSCPNCGASYLTAQTIQAIEQIKQNRGDRSEAKAIAVASF